MAKAGDVVEIGMAGRIVFRETAQDTDGERLVFDYFIPAGEESERERTRHLHRHPLQEERFRVVKGTVHGEVDGKDFTAGEGEEYEVPKDTWHLVRNGGEVEDAQLEVEMRPALETEDYFEAMSEIEVVGERGVPHPLHGAVVMKAYKDLHRVKMMDNPIIRVIVPILAAIGKRKGYSAQPGQSSAKRKGAVVSALLVAASGSAFVSASEVAGELACGVPILGLL
jgi:mannose-6-phosphate isomerase-like protein (cupin superfamily)